MKVIVTPILIVDGVFIREDWLVAKEGLTKMFPLVLVVKLMDQIISIVQIPMIAQENRDTETTHGGPFE